MTALRDLKPQVPAVGMWATVLDEACFALAPDAVDAAEVLKCVKRLVAQ